VPDGASALETLLRLKPFAVVTDLEMPSMDGRQLLAKIRARDAHVPVIVVTATHPHDADPSLESAFRVIRKPVHVEDLLSALASARELRAAQLPLTRLWSVASRSRLGMSRLRLSALQIAAIAVAIGSSVALFRYRQRAISQGIS